MSANSTALNLQIACGLTHSILCTDSGSVLTFGGGSKGQLGKLDILDNSGAPQTIDAKQCVNDEGTDRMVGPSSVALIQVSAGSYHTAALRKDGSVYTWGSNANGRLGHGDVQDASKVERNNSAPRMIKSLRGIPIMQVSCGADFTLVVDNSGTVYSWGIGNYGNLGHGDTQDQVAPKSILSLKSEVVRMVAAGAKHSLAVSQSGDVWSFGHGDNGRLGNNVTRGSLVPERTQGKVTTENCIFAAAGESHSACINDKGNVYTWGAGTYGRLGSGGENDQLVPMVVDTLAKVDTIIVACGAFHTCVLTVTGDLWAFGGGLYGKLGLGGQENSMIPVKMPRPQNSMPFTQVACGSFHTMAVTENGFVYAWGFGGHGRLGQTNAVDMLTTPMAINLDASSNKCTGSSTRKFQTLVTKQAATIQDGDQDEKIEELATRVVDVGAGAKHSMYCTSQGHVYSWGSNDCGQLGNRRNDLDPTTPEQIKVHIGGLRIVSVACGANHSLCVSFRGDVFSWGLGKSGQLGHGSSENMDTPNTIQMLQGKSIVNVFGGEDNSACVTDSGDLYTWGAGEMGKLGQGAGMTSCLLPRLVRGDLSDKKVVDVSLGLGHTAVIVNQGTLYTWGAGWFGRLGHGDTNNVYEPQKIETLVYKRFKHVSCGSYHTLAVTFDNECYTWGRGDERLGINARTNQLLPVVVESLSSRHINIDHVTASEEHSIAVATDGTVYAWGLGKYCKLGVSEPESKNKEEDAAFPSKVLSLYQKGFDIVTLSLGDAPTHGGGKTVVDRRVVKSLSNHNIALDQTGTVWVWGCAGQGRLGVQKATKSIPLAVPRDIAFHEDIYGDGLAGQAAGAGRAARKRGGGGSGVDGSGGGDGSSAASFGETKEGDSGMLGSGRGGGGGRGGRGGGGDDGHSSLKIGDIDEIVMRFRRDRTNPSSNFVHRLLRIEPTATRAKNIELMRIQIREDRERIEHMMYKISELEEQVQDLETETEVLIKSTVTKRMPHGLVDKKKVVPDDIVAHHSALVKILEMLLANPSYLKEMHKYFTGQSPEILEFWHGSGSQLAGTFKRGSGSQLAGTFKRRFAKLAMNIYGSLNRERNEHLFLVFARSIMLEELVQNAGKFDMAEVNSQFSGSESVFGEIVRNYFTSDRCVENINDRYKELFLELVNKTENNEYNFEYDPIQVYIENRSLSDGEGAVRNAAGRGQKFDDAYREELYQSQASTKNKVNARISKMSEIALKWISQTTSTIGTLPDGVCWICRQLTEELKKQYGSTGSSVELTVAHFLFDMYFRPGIVNPGAYGMIDSRKKLDRKVVKNLSEISNLVKRALTQTLFHQDRARWMSEANGIIADQGKTSLLWIQEVTRIDLDLPERMLNDVYCEHLGHGRVVHTMRLPEIQLLRWMMMYLNKFSTWDKDPMIPYVLGPYGICPDGKCRNAEEFLSRPDSYPDVGINYELNCRYFKVMLINLIKLDVNSVPLPRYLANDDTVEVKDLDLDTSALDSKRLAFEAWLRRPDMDFNLPEDDDVSTIRSVRERINTQKESQMAEDSRTGNNNFELLQQLTLALELLNQLESEKTPLSQVMGELLEQFADRRNIARRQKQQLDASQALLIKVRRYDVALRHRIIALTAFLNHLTKVGRSNNYDTAASAAKKLSKRLANPNMISGTDSSSKKDALKKKLARNNELHGSHRTFTYNELHRAGVVTDFVFQSSGTGGATALKPKEIKKTKKKLQYQVSDRILFAFGFFDFFSSLVPFSYQLFCNIFLFDTIILLFLTLSTVLKFLLTTDFFGKTRFVSLCLCL